MLFIKHNLIDTLDKDKQEQKTKFHTIFFKKAI